jgi:hypothetical protein
MKYKKIKIPYNKVEPGMVWELWGSEQRRVVVKSVSKVSMHRSMKKMFVTVSFQSFRTATGVMVNDLGVNFFEGEVVTMLIIDTSPKIIQYNNGNIVAVIGDDNSISISNTLSSEGKKFNLCVDGVESFLMTMHAQGIDISTPRMKTAVESALEQIANNL